MKAKLKTFVPLIFVIAAIGALVCCAYVMYNNSHRLSDMEMTLRGLSADKATASTTTTTSNMDALWKDAKVDGYRVSTDNEKIKSFLSEIMDWSSYDGYTAIREKTMKQYSLPEDCSFVKTFMPLVLNQDDGSGVKRNVIDDGSSIHPNGLRLSFEDAKSYVTKIEGDVYSYMNVVTVASSGAYGSEAKVTAAFLCDMDKDGNMSNLEANLLT